MVSLILDELLLNPHIRKCYVDDVPHFSIIDVLAELRNLNFKAAQRYYHVVKKRMKDNEILFAVKSVKARCQDNKRYSTDFVTYETIQLLVEHLAANLKREHYRINIRQDDEQLNFHPLVMSFFVRNGWHAEHHYRLRLGGQIDIVATHNDGTTHGGYIIECKPHLSRTNLYTALGQVLCYRAELDLDFMPAIATYLSQINSYTRACCLSLGITLVAVDRLENMTIQYNSSSGNYDLVTEKPLLPKKAKS